MKKILKTLSCLLTVVILAFSAAACSPATLEDYYRETSKMEELDAIADSQSTDTYTTKFYFEGNTIIFECQFKVGVTDMEKSILNETVESESFKQGFDDLVLQFRDETRVRSATVKVRYKDISGDIITEKEFNP